MTIYQKVKTACMIEGKTLTEVAKEFGSSQQTFSQRLQTGKFTQEELERIFSIIGCKYISYVELSDGKRL